MITGHRTKAPYLPRRILVALLLIGLVLVVSTPLLYRFLVEEPRHHALEGLLADRASRGRAAVDEFVSGVTDAVDRQLSELPTSAPSGAPSSSTDPERDRPVGWRALTDLDVPGFDEGYLIAADGADFPLPTNYLAQTLYERVLSGEIPDPVAARDTQWYLYVARPVAGEATGIEAVALFQVRLDPLKSALKDTLAGTNTRLFQSVGEGRRGVVFELGQPPVRGPEKVEETSLDRWQLSLRPTAQLQADAAVSWWYFAASTTVLWGLAALLMARLVRRNLQWRDRGDPRAAKKHSIPEDNLFTERFVKKADSGTPSPTALPDRETEPAAEQQTEVADNSEPFTQPVGRAADPATFPSHVFRAYDIRGRVDDEIDEKFAQFLGRVLGSQTIHAGEESLIVAGDARPSTPALKSALIKGILSAGCDVIDIGLVPTPVLNFALHQHDKVQSGVMVTASHNTAGDNGFKIFARHHALTSERIAALRDAMAGRQWVTGQGALHEAGVTDIYLQTIGKDILPPEGLKVVVEGLHGITGELAPALLKLLGCDVIELNCSPDGAFDGRGPDPTLAANLEELIQTVELQGADLGLAFDGDGDRLVAVSGSGRIVWPDELLMIFVKDVLIRTPGSDVIFDVKSTRRLQGLITSYGGRPVMWKTGHSHMHNKMLESGAPVGGEFSGHLFFNDRWFGFDDALYAAARLLEIIGLREQSLDEIVASFPESVATEEIKVAMDEEQKDRFVERLASEGDFGDGAVITTDGLRVEYAEGWGLVRASNTSPALTLRFEAESRGEVERIQALFKRQLHLIDPTLAIPF